MVTASQKFICIRPATYEDKSEGLILQSIFPGRGQLENTVFGLFEPDGETKLCDSGRSPQMVFSSVDQFLAKLTSISKRFEGKPDVERTLPTIPNLRLALNEAACDSAPLAVVLARSSADLSRHESALAKLAWDPRFVGRLRYVSVLTKGSSDLDLLGGLPRSFSKSSGVVIVEPDPFGTKGTLLSICSEVTNEKALAEALQAAIDGHAPGAKNPQKHIADGRRQGLEWESEMSVTDPDEQRRERGKKRRN